MPLRILLVDDHETVRVGLRFLLMGNSAWQICGEASNGREAVSKVRELAPDVVILDLTMPLMNGYETVAEIRKLAPATKIVIFSMHDTPVTAIQAGADAFVSKSNPAKELVAAIQNVTRCA